jgi:phosphoribosylglycinamide formyltransferase 1
MKIVILTGNESRHQYFRKKIALDSRIKVLATYCEDTELSLSNRVEKNPDSDIIERQHVDARTQSEHDFFSEAISFMPDRSCPKVIPKGAINEESIANEIEGLRPDLLICYGSSLIKSSLLKKFSGNFLNVHLGLSPYYRGSGTNVWPLINKELSLIGATFMHLNEGIDTGKIIHQIRADIFLGDSPHSIGNRLIRKMTEAYCEIVANYSKLTEEVQPNVIGKLYLVKDFDSHACRLLYKNINSSMIKDYIDGFDEDKCPYIVKNKGIS